MSTCVPNFEERIKGCVTNQDHNILPVFNIARKMELIMKKSVLVPEAKGDLSILHLNSRYCTHTDLRTIGFNYNFDLRQTGYASVVYVSVSRFFKNY